VGSNPTPSAARSVGEHPTGKTPVAPELKMLANRSTLKQRPVEENLAANRETAPVAVAASGVRLEVHAGD
jgi:hypothetical protein